MSKTTEYDGSAYSSLEFAVLDPSYPAVTSILVSTLATHAQVLRSPSAGTNKLPLLTNKSQLS